MNMLGLVVSLLAQDPSRTYPESTAIFPNPERGLFTWTDFVKTADVSDQAAKGRRIVHGLVHLDAYRDAALPAAFLATLGERFAAVRKAGMKVLLRFAYDFTEKGQDAPKERVLEHLAQLKPLFAAHEDVIVAMEAGFIGAWGEWHSSKNKLDAPEARKEILKATLDALPKSRMVKIRYPAAAKAIFGDEPPGEADAYTGSDRARVGHHNDCFLASADDMGTYWPPPIEALKSYTERWTKYAVMSGETCKLSPPRSDGKTALAELERFHWSMLHEGYHADVIQAWKYQGAWDEIQKRLGYRFVLREASWPASVAPGGTFTLALRIKNAGFASMFNRRNVYAVLSDGKSRHVLPLDGADPRRWWGGEETKISATLTAPGEPGTYRLGLWLPDAGRALRDRADYAVRFANEDVWDAKTGENVLTSGFNVGAGASIRRDGAIQVDGRPVFPVGYYHVSWVRGRSGETLRKDLALAAAAGADLFHPTLSLAPDVPALLDDARRLGVRFIPETDPKVLEKVVELHRDDPAVLAWNLGDDVTDRATVERIRETRRRVREIAPKALTYVSAYNSGEAWLGKPGASSWFKAGIDIVGMQNYPIPWEPGVGSHDWHDFSPGPRDTGNHRARVYWGMKRTVDQAGAIGHRAVLANIQAFRWNREGPAWRWPTAGEIDNMTWQAVAAGVNGVLFFAMHDATTYLPDQPEQWRQTSTTTADLRRIAPVLLAGKRSAFPVFEDPAARCVWATWSAAGEFLAVAVSVSDREEDVRIPLPPGTAGVPRAVFEHRPELLRLEGGALVGALPPGAVRILRLRP